MAAGTAAAAAAIVKEAAQVATMADTIQIYDSNQTTTTTTLPINVRSATSTTAATASATFTHSVTSAATMTTGVNGQIIAKGVGVCNASSATSIDVDVAAAAAATNYVGAASVVNTSSNQQHYLNGNRDDDNEDDNNYTNHAIDVDVQQMHFAQYHHLFARSLHESAYLNLNGHNFVGPTTANGTDDQTSKVSSNDYVMLGKKSFPLIQVKQEFLDLGTTNETEEVCELEEDFPPPSSVHGKCKMHRFLMKFTCHLYLLT